MSKTDTYLHEEGDLGGVSVRFLFSPQLSQHEAVVAVVLTHAGVVVDLVTAATVADDAGVGRQLELGRAQVLLAARAKVDVLAEDGRILRHLSQTESEMHLLDPYKYMYVQCNLQCNDYGYRNYERRHFFVGSVSRLLLISHTPNFV